MVPLTAPNQSKVARLSVGCPAGLSEHSYNAPAFAVPSLYLIKITYLTSNITFLNTLHVATLAILK
jgi:hypothetical protein